MPDFNSNQVSLSLGGVPLSGFGEDTTVSIEWDSDITTDKISVDGVVTASKTNDLRATATITLMESSPSNAVLTGFYAARQAGGDAIGVVPFMLEDSISGERVNAAEAWVLKAPTVEKGKEAGEREWAVRLAKAGYLHTGGTV